MGGWNSQGKTEADGLKKISVFFLKKHGYFKQSQSGTIGWTNNWTGKRNSVSIGTSITDEGRGHLRIFYTQTSESGEKKDFDYQIPITSTPCRYGGRRYWFICPMSKRNQYCGKRVAVLYKNGDFFACRHCYGLTYATRNYSGRYKGFVSIPDIEEAEMKVKRQYYRGRPTRQYRRVLKLNRQFDQGFIDMAATTLVRLKRIKGPKRGGKL